MNSHGIHGQYINDAADRVHRANAKWWISLVCKHCKDIPGSGNCVSPRGHEFEPLERNVGEMLMLVVSELAEAL